MSKVNHYDCIIVGGGLSGSLLFYGLKSTHPNAKVLLLEKDQSLGGNHTWCFHESDIKKYKNDWVRELISKSWASYEVIFPRYRRTLSSFYHSIQSNKLHDLLIKKYPNSILLNSNILSLGENEVKLSTGEILSAHCVVDARGWKKPESPPSGYQKFVGLDIKLKRPHGLTGVRLKDVRVEQIDGYRFIYVLPWSEDEILIEDTYYSNSSELNIEEIKNRILSYVNNEGWEVERILRKESGCLPLTSSFDTVTDEGPVTLGARSGEYQPVTGYTFPQTFHRIHELLTLEKINTDVWKQKLNQIRRQDKKHRAYFHFLNKLLFHAASQEKRYKILEHFYTLPSPLIERFYQGKLSDKDKIRIFIGKPPVSIIQFLRILVRRC